MDALMTKMSATNPDWSGLPDVFDIWNKHAVKHACKTILNAKHDHCAPLLRKMEEYRKANEKLYTEPEEDEATQINTRYGATKDTKKRSRSSVKGQDESPNKQ